MLADLRVKIQIESSDRNSAPGGERILNDKKKSCRLAAFLFGIKFWSYCWNSRFSFSELLIFGANDPDLVNLIA